MLCSPETVDNKVTSGDLKTYAKIASEIYEADGILYHNNKVIVPSELRPEMLQRIHYKVIWVLKSVKFWLVKQRVVLNGIMSSWLYVISGVPLGSILGSLLFLILMTLTASFLLLATFLVGGLLS